MTLHDVNFEFTGGGTAEQAQAPLQGPLLDARALPVWGLYVRKVKTLEMQNVRMNLVAPDARPAFRADDVDRIDMDTFRTSPGGAPPLILHGVRELNLRDTDAQVITR